MTLGIALPSRWVAGRARIRLLKARSILTRHFDYAIDIGVDALLGIDTFVPALKRSANDSARNRRYEPLPYRALRTIARHLPLSEDDVLIDLGSGKGRVLCLAATALRTRCAGVEVSPSLANAALNNIRRLRWRHRPIDLANTDAADAAIGDASVVFMYNPFSAEVLRRVLQQVDWSLRNSPRKLRICYANPTEGAVLDECPWLACVEEFLVIQNGRRACPVKIWTTRH